MASRDYGFKRLWLQEAMTSRSHGLKHEPKIAFLSILSASFYVILSKVR
jgi:hypothetical protein